MGLKKQALSGIIWTFTQQVGVQGINFFVQIILARFLLPEAFGLIAMIQLFMAIGKALMDGGMTSSLIRTKNPDQSDYSTIFFINLFSSILIYAILFSTAPFISSFFQQPQLTLLIRVYTFSFIIQALVGVQTTRLTKEMNFKLQMYMQIPSSICGGLVGVILAYKGFGVWSLVYLQLTTTFLFMIQHWFKTDWRPSLIFDIEKFKYHFNYGYKLTFSALLTTIYTNSYTLLIGKMFSATQLGYYNQADTLRMFPVRNLTSALQKVTFPLFSSIQNDDKRIKSVFKRITLLVFFIIAPIMLALILVAKPLFKLVLTEKWLPSVPFFQILCISAIFYPLSMYNLNIILAKGRSDLHLKLELLKKSASISFLLLIVPFGIYGAVYAAAISMFIHAFVNSFYSGRLINYPLKEQLKDISPILLIGAVSMAIAYLVHLFLNSYFRSHDFLNICMTLTLFFSVYIFISHLLRIDCIGELNTIAAQFRKKIKGKK